MLAGRTLRAGLNHRSCNVYGDVTPKCGCGCVCVCVCVRRSIDVYWICCNRACEYQRFAIERLDWVTNNCALCSVCPDGRVCVLRVCPLRVSGVTIIVKTLLMLRHKFVAYCAFAKVIFFLIFVFVIFLCLGLFPLILPQSVCNELKSVLSSDIIQGFFNLTALLCEEFLISLI